MNVPTVNVIMSTSPKDIFAFLGSETLELFTSKAKGISTKETLIFNNGPASNFLSMSHEIGMSKDGGPKLKIEFIDPQQVFEERMSSFTVDGLMPVESQLTSYQIKKLKLKVQNAEAVFLEKEQELIEAQKKGRKSGVWSGDWAKAKVLEKNLKQSNKHWKLLRKS